MSKPAPSPSPSRRPRSPAPVVLLLSPNTPIHQHVDRPINGLGRSAPVSRSVAASQTQSASTASWIQVDSMRQRPSLGISCYLKPEADPRNLPGNRRPGSTPSDPAALPCDRRRVRGLIVGEHDSRFPLLWKTATNILDLDLYGLLPSLLILSCHFLARRRWSRRHARWCRWRCRRLMRRLRCVD
jgi:hypothetical protein